MGEYLFESERLYGREFEMRDWEPFHDMQSNPNVMKYVGQDAMNEIESKADLEKILKHYSTPNDGFRVWGVFLRDSHEMVGTGALLTNEKGNELGYRLREKHWGKGFATEIANSLLSYGFDVLEFSEIFAEVDERNHGSVRVLDKTMNRIKKFWNEEWNSHDYYYTLSKEEYEKNRH